MSANKVIAALLQWSNRPGPHCAGADRDRRRRRDGLQPVQLGKHILPAKLILLGRDRGGGIVIELQDVVAQLWRRAIEFPFRQLGKQLCIGIVGERVFRRLCVLAGIEIAVRKHEFVAAHFFEKCR